MSTYNFQVEWKNRLDQMGETSIDVDIRNVEGLIPSVWLNRTYSMDAESINESFLTSEAQNIIDQMITEYENSIIIPEE